MKPEQIAQLARDAFAASIAGDTSVFSETEQSLQGAHLQLFWEIYESLLPRPVAPWSREELLPFTERQECSGFGAVK